MSDHERDFFAEGREVTEGLRQEMESVRADVRAIVQEEVDKAGIPDSELRRRIADVVRGELAHGPGPVRSGPTALWVGVAGAVGVLAGAFGARTLWGPETVVEPVLQGEAAVSTQDVPAPDRPTESTVRVPSPADRAARYDSLFSARSPSLVSLVTELEGAGPAAAVAEAIAAWRDGVALDPGSRRRLHDGLVQWSLNRVAGTNLSLDGLVTRGPCAGASCGALLRLWETRGAELGFPPYSPDPAANEAALGLAERSLVLTVLEPSGG